MGVYILTGLHALYAAAGIASLISGKIFILGLILSILSLITCFALNNKGGNVVRKIGLVHGALLGVIGAIAFGFSLYIFIFQKPEFLLPIISIIAILIGFFTFKLIRKNT